MRIRIPQTLSPKKSSSSSSSIAPQIHDHGKTVRRSSTARVEEVELEWLVRWGRGERGGGRVCAF